MQIEGLIPFKSSTFQAMASLDFLRIFNCFNPFSSIKLAAMIIGYAFSSPKKAYFKWFGSSFKINPS